jgi:predicted small lipoprotein YifL
MRTLFTTRLLLLAFTLVVTGCGQKGPLYLPDEQEQPAATDNSEEPEI